jgi:hypothetical protein
MMLGSRYHTAVAVGLGSGWRVAMHQLLRRRDQKAQCGKHSCFAQKGVFQAGATLAGPLHGVQEGNNPGTPAACRRGSTRHSSGVQEGGSTRQSHSGAGAPFWGTVRSIKDAISRLTNCRL